MNGHYEFKGSKLRAMVERICMVHLEDGCVLTQEQWEAGKYWVADPIDPSQIQVHFFGGYMEMDAFLFGGGR